MKTPTQLFTALLMFFAYPSLASLSGANKKTMTSEGFPVKVHFTENKGQVSDQNGLPRQDVLFGGKTGNLVFHLRNNGISYQMIQSLKTTAENATASKSTTAGKDLVRYRLDLNWINCNTNAEIVKEKVVPGFSNYYLAVCPQGVTNVRSYDGVTYKGLYKGVDLKWHEKNGALKYDFIIEAGADYKNIRYEVKGANRIYISGKGELIMVTPLGKISENAPEVMQAGRKLKASWKVSGTEISFDIIGVDPALPIVIDPAVRLWGTFYGDGQADAVLSTATDASGNVYIAGHCGLSTGTTIATSGSHQDTWAGVFDAYLAKFDAAGVRLWATFYGGSSQDRGTSCCTDPNGNVYLAGFSESTVAISSPGAHQSNYGGATDGFLAKFNSSGVRQWGTYYGGTGSDRAQGCSFDPAGYVFLVGFTETSTSSVIATPAAHQTNFGGGNFDGFIAQFNTSGVIQWGSYYGGSADDYVWGCAADLVGNVYISGSSQSGNGTSIATIGSYQSSSGGAEDAFLVKFNPVGVRQWGTYFGDASVETGSDCTVDPVGRVYLVGTTQSTAGIASAGGHQQTKGGGADAFLAQFSSSGTRNWSTYYGGANAETGSACTADYLGNVYLAGTTASPSDIATPGSHDVSGSATDAFLAKFNFSGQRIFGTYYGGTATDQGFACTTFSNTFYLAGNSSSIGSNDVATSGSHQVAVAGNSDGFLASFFECIEPAAPTVTSSIQQACASANGVTLSASGTGTISWYSAPSAGTLLYTGNVYTVNLGFPNVFAYYAQALTCLPSASRTAVSVTIHPLPTAQAASSTTLSIPCAGESVTLSASGGSTYTWMPDALVGQTVVVTPTASTVYTVVTTDTNTCTDSETTFVTVQNCTGLMEETLRGDFFIYPNPVSEELFINLSQATNVEFRIIDISGKEIISGKCEPGKPIEVDKLSDGIYFIELQDDGRAQRLKFTKL